MKDSNIHLSSKQELHHFTAKRSAYVDTLIQTDINSAITYLLTGYSANEFFEKEFQYFRDEQLASSLEDFSDELRESISLLQSAKQIISLLQNEPVENQHEILNRLKLDLEYDILVML